MIDYRWLTPEEVQTLEPVFVENGGDLPDPRFSGVVGAVTEEGQIVGFHVIQLVPHAEPMWINPEFRAKVSWREFQKQIESVLEGGEYYIFPGDERIAKLCRRGGMQEVPLKAYKKSVGT